MLQCHTQHPTRDRAILLQLILIKHFQFGAGLRLSTFILIHQHLSQINVSKPLRSETFQDYWRHQPVVVKEEASQVGQVRQGVRSKLLDRVVAQVPDDDLTWRFIPNNSWKNITLLDFYGVHAK